VVFLPIPINDYNLFVKSLDLLSDFNVNKSNGILALLALKYDDGHTVPLFNSRNWATSKEIEDLFDYVYGKSDSRLGQDDGKVFKILNRKRDQVPTTANRWRNILATQKGIVCYAPTHRIKNHNFLLQSYKNCLYRRNGKCAYNPQGQQCVDVWAKLLQKKFLRGPKRCRFRRTVWSLDLESLLFSDTEGNIHRIPLYPLIVAIYFGSNMARGRSYITVENFKREFHLSRSEFKTLFDENSSSYHNTPILATMNPQDRNATQTETHIIMEQSEDSTEPPARVSATVSRFIRNTLKSDSLKSAYNYKCQICDKQIKKPDGSLYAEAHHIRPLGDPHHGSDVCNNMIVLCPNHHAEFDYGIIAIDPNNNTVIHIDASDPYHGKNVFFTSRHRLKRENLEYHLYNIFSK
jgi:hypothetical protein